MDTTIQPYQRFYLKDEDAVYAVSYQLSDGTDRYACTALGVCSMRTFTGDEIREALKTPLPEEFQ